MLENHKVIVFPINVVIKITNLLSVFNSIKNVSYYTNIHKT